MSSRPFSPGTSDTALPGAGRPRLVVIACSVGNLVESAGGFLCDRAWQGWDVTVVAADVPDSRPLTVLGIARRDVDADLERTIRGVRRGEALAVSAALLGIEAHLRREVAHAVARGAAEITVWGTPAKTEVGHGLESVERPMSRAARAFKAQALLAAGRGVDGAVAGTETLFRPTGGAFRRLHRV